MPVELSVVVVDAVGEVVVAVIVLVVLSVVVGEL